MALMASSSVQSPVTATDKPLSLGTPKIRCRRGLRMSASTMSVRPWVCDMTVARLTATVVLPAPASPDVTAKERMARSGDMKRRLVRNVRQYSLELSLGRSAIPGLAIEGDEMAVYLFSEIIDGQIFLSVVNRQHRVSRLGSPLNQFGQCRKVKAFVTMLFPAFP